ncbi:MAG TPA: SUMF1/EgtB/PvdO family nonheme iron enzyme, partial [Gemmataceae bacterium]|nr:SUMF1/EgtB/PvdO family nonheme iron enzyme [Gemmataceae bacterium]
KNGKDRTWPVGSLKPNDLGLFDTQGNVLTWCQNKLKSYPEGNKATDDTEDDLVVESTDIRIVRSGGSYDFQARNVRSAQRNPSSGLVVNRYGDYGFRLARTLRLGSIPALPPTAEGGRK